MNQAYLDICQGISYPYLWYPSFYFPAPITVDFTLSLNFRWFMKLTWTQAWQNFIPVPIPLRIWYVWWTCFILIVCQWEILMVRCRRISGFQRTEVVMKSDMIVPSHQFSWILFRKLSAWCYFKIQRKVENSLKTKYAWKFIFQNIKVYKYFRSVTDPYPQNYSSFQLLHVNM